MILRQRAHIERLVTGPCGAVRVRVMLLLL